MTVLRRWVASLQELDRLAAEVERARAMYEHTRTSQGAEAFRLRYERAVAEFNARRFWWVRAKRPNVEFSRWQRIDEFGLP